MDPKHGSDHMVLAPGAAGSPSYAFPNRDHRPTFPPVDQHLVKPEVSREEIIRGRKISTMGANPEHAEANSRLDFVVVPHVRKGYVVATDLLTRVTRGSNFATDVCIRKEGIDPTTGVRYLEELSFEIVNEQSMRDAMEKAEDLIGRGVRRVIAIVVKTGEICEWFGSKREFVPMDKGAVFEDHVFVRPIAVGALVDATLGEVEVVRALDKKGNEEIQRIRREAEGEGQKEGHKTGLDEGQKKGHKTGLDEGQRKMLVRWLCSRFGELPAAIESRILAADASMLNAWADKIDSATSLDDVFDAS
jgi:hypothetical protein